MQNGIDQVNAVLRPSVFGAADFYMSLYNVVFTALTPLIVGTMDSDVNREMSRKYPGEPLAASAFWIPPPQEDVSHAILQFLFACL